MITQRLRDLLEENQVRFTIIPHPAAVTAQETAAAAHVSGKELAKTVIASLDGELTMLVLAAPDRVDWDRLAAAVDATTAEQVYENDFRDRFPDCEVGAMPPFGHLYGMHVYVDEQLTQRDEIAFNAGSHRELVRLRYEDFARLARPTLASFSRASAAISDEVEQASSRGGEPGDGAGRRDEVGGSGVYPASGGWAPQDAVIRNQGEWGEGVRGPTGPQDAGSSELFFYEAELRAADPDAEEREEDSPLRDEGPSEEPPEDRPRR